MSDDRPEITMTVPLRWRDLDLLGHVNQSVYHELLEEVRAGLLAELVARVGGDMRDNAYVLARVELDYRHEVRKDHGTVELMARVGRVGTSSFTMDCEVRLPDGTIAAEGTTVMVAWDAVRRGKRELSAQEREALGAPAA